MGTDPDLGAELGALQSLLARLLRELREIKDLLEADRSD